MIGFVYILVNDYMPDIYKVGCTERSPHERAAELSKPTGVPAPFEVLCYIEVEGFQQAEQQLHAWLENFRISTNREFFERGLHHAVGWLYHHRTRLSFCSIVDTTRGGHEFLVAREDIEPHLEEEGPIAYGLDRLPDPWAPKAVATQEPEEPEGPSDDQPLGASSAVGAGFDELVEPQPEVASPPVLTVVGGQSRDL